MRWKDQDPNLFGHQVIPVAVIADLDDAVGPLAAALERGGLPIVEVTFRTDAAAQAIRLFAAEKGMLVGAGTIVRPEQVDEAVEAGARFMVTPGLSRSRGSSGAVDSTCPSSPGWRPPTEVIAALDRGSRSAARALPGRGGRWCRAPPALRGPFPMSAWSPDRRRDQRSNAAAVPHRAVGRSGRRQLDGGARADRGPRLRRHHAPGAGGPSHSQPRVGEMSSGLAIRPAERVPLRPRRARR